MPKLLAYSCSAAEVLMGIAVNETTLVRACLDWLALHRILAWRMNNAGVFDPGRKVFRSFRGARGVPDILGICPRKVKLADGSQVTIGSFLGIECKRPGARPRPEQEAFLQGICDRGGIGLCVHTLRELEEQLRPLLP
jgi:hypothetical protein